jgi:hypothetical protein
VSIVLNRQGLGVATDRRVLLDNRNRRGLFFTWFLPRLRWTSAPHRKVMLEQWRLIRKQGPFFDGMSAEYDDIDAVVNANCLFALGPFKGDTAVVDYLMKVLRDGDENVCDKWYDNTFAVWYFFSRALRSRVSGAAQLILTRMASAAPESALDLALATSTLMGCGEKPPEEWIVRLLDAQLPSGAWPRAVIYTGGRARDADGRCRGAYPAGTPFWGSEGVTTAFCLEALGRFRKCIHT